MEETVVVSDNLTTVLETVFLFLKNQNFFKSSEAFRIECEQLGVSLPNKSGKVFFRTDEKIDVIENSHSPSKKFIDKRVVLETFLQKDDITIDNFSGENDVRHNADIEGKQHLKKKFIQLQEEYKNLLTVTAELTNVLQVHIVGQTKTINSVLNQCKTIYPSLFETQIAEEDDKLSKIKNEETALRPGLCPTASKDSEQIETPDENGKQFAIDDSVAKDEDHKDSKQENSVPLSDDTGIIIPTVYYESSTANIGRITSETDAQEDEPNHLPLSNTGVRLEYNGAPTEVSCTPVPQEEIKDILESVLIRVPYLFKETEETESGCCLNETVRDCKNEISRILEDIVFKVMISPRCPTSSYNSNAVPDRSSEHFVKLNMDAEENCSHCNMEEGTSQKQTANSQKITDFVLFPFQQSSERKSQSKSSTARANEDSKEQCHSKPVKVMMFQTPLCYADVCRKTQDGKYLCRCARCVPGQSRYYCGCYDYICEEITEEIDALSSGSTCNEKLKFFKNYHKTKGGDKHILVDKFNDENCSTFCENKICKGAFDSKPRIRRTPPR